MDCCLRSWSPRVFQREWSIYLCTGRRCCHSSWTWAGNSTSSPALHWKLCNPWFCLQGSEQLDREFESDPLFPKKHALLFPFRDFLWRWWCEWMIWWGDDQQTDAAKVREQLIYECLRCFCWLKVHEFSTSCLGEWWLFAWCSRSGRWICTSHWQDHAVRWPRCRQSSNRIWTLVPPHSFLPFPCLSSKYLIK